MKCAAVVFVIVLVAACRRTPIRAEVQDRRVVMTIEEGRRAFDWPDSPYASGFVPTDEELDDFEARLPGELAKSRKPELARRAPNDHRQYVGYVDSHGKRWIWGNYLCSIHPAIEPYWRKGVIRTHDGGSCFFNVEFSPETKEFRHLEINGDA